jgi:hypothetical protein
MPKITAKYKDYKGGDKAKALKGSMERGGIKGKKAEEKKPAPKKSAAEKEASMKKRKDAREAAKANANKKREKLGLPKKKEAAPKKAEAPKKAAGKVSKFGKGNKMTVEHRGREMANVSAEQLKASGLSLRQYMNKWKKTGKRP